MALDDAFMDAWRAISFKYPHPMYRFGHWRLVISGPWDYRDPAFTWSATATPHNPTGYGLNREIEGFGKSAEEALMDLVENIEAVERRAIEEEGSY